MELCYSILTMTVGVYSITAEESDTLDRWQRGDETVRYRRARVLRLSETGWRRPVIADALALHPETLRRATEAFSGGRIEAVTPVPRSGGRPPGHTREVADVAEGLACQEPANVHPQYVVAHKRDRP